MPNVSPKHLKMLLLGVFCFLLATQCFYIYRSFTMPNHLAHILYRNNIPKECSLTNYETLITRISDYVHEQDIKTGKKTIVLATFGSDSVGVIVPTRSKPGPDVTERIRQMLAESLRSGVENSQPCFSGGTGTNSDLPLLSVEVQENNVSLKILDWVALFFNLGVIAYLLVDRLRKKA